ncbi:MAG: SGNH/GDSL hydrolase family protein [Mongoliibacter sp.]|uniref:SGNH/GDSL hydrolase family protein n=1 Tax=Mongoliibacter sp. TaxID=2022438 RepID=UPI0012F06F61|nr:SGNH/GDSL hydrolase family protein [Mongoliibacter sp.]TVP53350.1 MAG: SGNH/GDSL hydrolase family protein [Mongoliibacter sp.]
MIQSILYLFVFAHLQSYIPEIPTNGNDNYLDQVIEELGKKWPENRTVNIVFHGHSVPAGYFKTPNVNTMNSYPFLFLLKLKEEYPYAVVNVIVTAKGGENSENGSKRFQSEVLSHRPDVIFIDYALNDRNLGLDRSRSAWVEMIKSAKEYGAKVILMTPTPDLKENIKSHESKLYKHADQIRSLSSEFEIGLVDSYLKFREIAKQESLTAYMSQANHINESGHEIVANSIFSIFRK